MKKETLRSCEWLLALLVLVPLGFLTGRCTAPKTPVEPLSRDTVIVTHYDTITREKPVYITKTVVDTMRVPVVDTLRISDTLWLALPREQRTYGDTTYRAWVSGVEPSLDSIRIRQTVRVCYVTERMPVEVSRKWSLGVHAGYGAVLQQGGVTLSPYVGLGVSYNLLSW